MDEKDILATYAEVTGGYSEPDYMEIQLSSFREMAAAAGELKDYAAKFLAEMDANHIPETAIVVMTPGRLALLTDDKGRLLSFR